MKNIGVFLDRDGTINEEVDYLTSPNDLRLIPGSTDAIREAKNAGFKVFITTNQSGVARGFITEEQLTRIHKTLIEKLQEDNAHLDAIYYCPHHPEIGEAPYRKDCECRKPNTGMLIRAAKEFNLDLTKSFVVGDMMIDVQTGNNAGAISILVLTGYGQKELELCRHNNVHIDYVAKDLLDAIQYIRHAVQQSIS
jgi:D-glycero-D-manno-heptose 1,7-bisphosphate phosphatase